MSRAVSKATDFHVLVQISHFITISILGPIITLAGKEVESPTLPFKSFQLDVTRHFHLHFIKSHLASGEPRIAIFLNTLMKRRKDISECYNAHIIYYLC